MLDEMKKSYKDDMNAFATCFDTIDKTYGLNLGISLRIIILPLSRGYFDLEAH